MRLALLTLLALALPVSASVDNERQELTLIQTQLHQLDYLISRAEREADYRLTRQFDYQSLRSDIRSIQAGIDAYLRPERVDARPIEPIGGDYVSK